MSVWLGIPERRALSTDLAGSQNSDVRSVSWPARANPTSKPPIPANSPTTFITAPVHARTGITRVDERANAYMSHVRRSTIHYMVIKASDKEHCVNINALPRSGSRIPDPLRVSGFGVLLTP